MTKENRNNVVGEKMGVMGEDKNKTDVTKDVVRKEEN